MNILIRLYNKYKYFQFSISASRIDLFNYNSRPSKLELDKAVDFLIEKGFLDKIDKTKARCSEKYIDSEYIRLGYYIKIKN